MAIGYDPYPKQRAFHGGVECHLLSAFIGGIGSGKTTAGAAQALKYSLEHSGSVGCVVAPTYPMLRDTTQAQFLRMCPRELVRDWNKTENKVELVNGSVVLFRSTEHPDRLRNLNLWWWWVDEGGLVSEMAFLVLLGRLREGGDARRGWVTGTPKGLGWLYREFGSGKKPNRFMVQASSRENPYLPEGYVEELEETYGGLFKEQEIEGKFVRLEGLIYPMLEGDEERYICEMRRDVFSEFYGGIDWGWTSPAAFGVVGVTADGRCVHIFEEEYREKMTIDEIVDRVRVMSREWGVLKWFCGHEEPENIERLRREGIDAERADTSILGGISDVSHLLSLRVDDEMVVDGVLDRKVEGGLPGLTWSHACPNSFADCKTYSWGVDRSGGSTGLPAKGQRDHGADWIRYVVRGIKSRMGTRPRVVLL